MNVVGVRARRNVHTLNAVVPRYVVLSRASVVCPKSIMSVASTRATSMKTTRPSS
jgi:hypothetical protein